MSVPRTIEGIGLAGLIVVIMAVFGCATLLVIFIFHSGLAGVYAISEQTHIPFLVLLAAPIWIGLPLGLTIDGIRWLLKHIS